MKRRLNVNMPSELLARMKWAMRHSWFRTAMEREVQRVVEHVLHGTGSLHLLQPPYDVLRAMDKADRAWDEWLKATAKPRKRPARASKRTAGSSGRGKGAGRGRAKRG